MRACEWGGASGKRGGGVTPAGGKSSPPAPPAPPVLQAPAPGERRLILAGTYEVDSGRSGFMCFASRITRADGSGRKSHPCPWTEVLPISPTVRIWVVLTTSGVTRARLWASAGRLHALVGLHVVLTYVPNSFRFPTEVPETHCEYRKKHCARRRVHDFGGPVRAWARPCGSPRAVGLWRCLTP